MEEHHLGHHSTDHDALVTALKRTTRSILGLDAEKHNEADSDEKDGGDGGGKDVAETETRVPLQVWHYLAKKHLNRRIAS